MVQETKKILRKRDVCEITGLSSSTVFRLERAGQFPRRVKLGVQAVGWIASELDEWIASRAVVQKSSEKNDTSARL